MYYITSLKKLKKFKKFIYKPKKLVYNVTTK